jgi:hypothetical protein
MIKYFVFTVLQGIDGKRDSSLTINSETLLKSRSNPGAGRTFIKGP